MKSPPMTNEPCQRCLELVHEGVLEFEALQRMPEGAFAPRARRGNVRVCFDCASADALMERTRMTFEMARVCVGNDRMDSYRWPEGVQLGLALQGAMRMPSETLEQHHEWLNGVVPGWADSF